MPCDPKTPRPSRIQAPRTQPRRAMVLKSSPGPSALDTNSPVAHTADGFPEPDRFTEFLVNRASTSHVSWSLFTRNEINQAIQMLLGPVSGYSGKFALGTHTVDTLPEDGVTFCLRDEKEKIMVPVEETYEFIRYHHGNHIGGTATYNSIRADGRHINIRVVKEFLKHCPTCCLRTSRARQALDEANQAFATASPSVFLPAKSNHLRPDRHLASPSIVGTSRNSSRPLSITPSPPSSSPFAMVTSRILSRPLSITPSPPHASSTKCHPENSGAYPVSEPAAPLPHRPYASRSTHFSVLPNIEPVAAPTTTSNGGYDVAVALESSDFDARVCSPANLFGLGLIPYAAQTLCLVATPPQQPLSDAAPDMGIYGGRWIPEVGFEKIARVEETSRTPLRARTGFSVPSYGLPTPMIPRRDFRLGRRLRGRNLVLLLDLVLLGIASLVIWEVMRLGYLFVRVPSPVIELSTSVAGVGGQDGLDEWLEYIRRHGEQPQSNGYPASGSEAQWGGWD